MRAIDRSMFNKNSKKNENLDLELEENSLSLCVCVCVRHHVSSWEVFYEKLHQND